jgi:hypothetical protein
MSVRLEVVVCEGPTCGERGAGGLRPALLARLRARAAAERVAVTPTICFGHCQRGPNVLVCPVDRGGPMAWQGVLGPGTMLLHGVTPGTVGGLDALLDALASHDPDAGPAA